MKSIYFTLMAFLFMMNVSAQKNELTGSVNSGLFSFTGQSTEKTSFINYSDQSKTGYTNNPYGSKYGLCYGFSVNIKRITKINLIFGLDLGYESLRSKISIDRIVGDNYQYDAIGKTYLNYNLLNFNPFIGYRVYAKNFSFNITGGYDCAYILNGIEKGSATAANGLTFTTSRDRKSITNDLRSRVQFAVDYKMFGIFIGYSKGMINYTSGVVGGKRECYARLIRFGFTYKIK